jgi:molybdenum-dependent DNA-binding transcriptional regulator ModE
METNGWIQDKFQCSTLASKNKRLVEEEEEEEEQQQQQQQQQQKQDNSYFNTFAEPEESLSVSKITKLEFLP